MANKQTKIPAQFSQPGCCTNCGYLRNECAMDENCDFAGGGWDSDDEDEDELPETVIVARARALVGAGLKVRTKKVVKDYCLCNRAIGGRDEDGLCFSCGFEVK